MTPSAQMPAAASHGGSFAGKAAWSGLSVVILAAGRFGAGIIAARTLGPAISGEVIYLLWLADSVSLVASLGLHATLTRFTAELNSQGRPQQATALLRWTVVRYMVVQCLFSAALALTLPAVTGVAISQPARLLLLAYSLSQAANTFVTSHLAGRQRFDLMARLSAVSGVLLTIGVAMGCLFGGLSGAILGYALGALPGVFFVRRMLRTGGAGACALDTAVRARAMRYGLFTCFAAVLSAFVWSRTEIYFLSRYCGFHAVAMFNVGLSLCAMVNQAAALMTSSLVPHFAALAGRADLDSMRRNYTALTRLVGLLVFPLSMTFAAVAPVLVPLLYGRAFVDAIPTATALATLASLSVANVGSALVYGREKSWFIAATGTGGALLALAGGLLIVPTWGALGAAASRAAVQCIMIGVGTWYIQVHLQCPFPWLPLGKTMSAALLAAGAARSVVYLRPGPLGLALALSVSAVLYGALVRALGLFQPCDAEVVYRMLPALPTHFATPVRRATGWVVGLR
jgi:O-antigen/teichoic acid export membrane protein